MARSPRMSRWLASSRRKGPKRNRVEVDIHLPSGHSTSTGRAETLQLPYPSLKTPSLTKTLRRLHDRAGFIPYPRRWVHRQKYAERRDAKRAARGKGVRRALAVVGAPRGGPDGRPRRACGVGPERAFRVAVGVARLPRPGAEGSPGRHRVGRGSRLRGSEVRKPQVACRDDATRPTNRTSEEELVTMKKRMFLTSRSRRWRAVASGVTPSSPGARAGRIPGRRADGGID